VIYNDLLICRDTQAHLRLSLGGMDEARTVCFGISGRGRHNGSDEGWMGDKDDIYITNLELEVIDNRSRMKC